MKALVIYATHKGNTRRVAEAIANGLRSDGSAAVRSVDESPTIADEDLIVIGGPTEGHHVIPELYEFLNRLPAGALTGRRVAAFDTRLDWPRWMSGSAADDIGRRVESLDAWNVVRPESFFVSMVPEVRAGELTRARAWGAGLAHQIQPFANAQLAAS